MQRWLGDITGVFARGKIIQPLREAYNVIVPDLLTVLCSFEGGAEGVLEFSGINAWAEGDRLEIYGSGGTLTYDFTADVMNCVAGVSRFMAVIGAAVPVLRFNCVAPFSMVLRNSVGRMVDSGSGSNRSIR